MWLGKGGGGVRVTGRGWVGSEGSGPEVGAEGAGPGEGDNESSGSEVGEGYGAADGGDLSRLTVKSGWGVCRFVSTLRCTLESKVENEFLSLIFRFSVQPESRLHLPVEVSAILDWGFQGEDGLSPLSCRNTCHPPRAALSIP